MGQRNVRDSTNGKVVDLSGEHMYTVARCMDTCGKPLAMGATTKLEDVVSVRIGQGRMLHRPL